MLTGLHRNKDSNERSRFAFEVATKFVQSHPKECDGIVRIGAEEEDVYAKVERWSHTYSPLSIALCLFPVALSLNLELLRNDVKSYLHSLIDLTNGNLLRFPAIAWEFGE
jgi:hypothetical protein